MTHIVWRNDILTAEDIFLLQQTPKYIKINLVNEQINGLKHGDNFRIISAFSKPCIRCNFFFNDGSIQNIFGEKGVNIPLCYPDYILTLPSDRYLWNVESLAEHSSMKVRPSPNKKHLLDRIPFFQRSEFHAKGLKNEMLSLLSDDREVYLPLELNMEFMELNDSESLLLEDFVTHHSFPRYVKFLNWKLAQETFEIDIRNSYAEIEFVFEQHLLICEKLETIDSDSGSHHTSENAQWAFSTLNVNESLCKSMFNISEQYGDLQSSNLFVKADFKIAVKMANTSINFEQKESVGFMLNQTRISQYRKKEQRLEYSYRDDSTLAMSRLSGDEPNLHTIKAFEVCMKCIRRPQGVLRVLDKAKEWSSEKHFLSRILKNKQQLPKYLKLAYCDESKDKSKHEFLLEINAICEIIEIQKDVCLRVKYIDNSSKPSMTNIPLSYPYMVLDRTKAYDDRHTVLENCGKNQHDFNNSSFVSLTSLAFDRKSKKQIKIIEKENGTNYTFRYLRHFSHEIDLIKKFDQSYVILRVFNCENDFHTVIVPVHYAQSKFQFFISVKHSLDFNESDVQTLQVDEAIKTAASNFPIEITEQ